MADGEIHLFEVMRFDRLEVARRESDVGRLYWFDLRLIREAKGIAIKTVHQKTRVPLEILASFEKGGLVHRDRFNRVYRRSLAAAYARAIDIDPDEALRSSEESEIGRYRGRLARRYLGVQPQKSEESEVHGEASSNDAERDNRRLESLETGQFGTEEQPVSDRRNAVEPKSHALPYRRRLIIAALIVVVILVWIVVTVA